MLQSESDRGYIPDFVLRRAIRALNAQRIGSLPSPAFPASYEKYIAHKLDYVQSLKQREIAIDQDKANEQHYEVDTGFMMSCLGARAKYSCCLYPTGKETLDEAEGGFILVFSSAFSLWLIFTERVLDNPQF